MEKSMVGCMKKLALWHTKTFKPILTHEELEPIMATLGFMTLPEKPASNGVVWLEYSYAGRFSRSLSSGTLPPNARLPSHVMNGQHRIDGLHVYTYRVFIDAVKMNTRIDDISDLFHVRGLPLQPIDQSKKYRRMDEDDPTYVYKDGTLEQARYNHCRSENKNVSSNNNEHSSATIRDKGSNSSYIGTMVPLKDIIVLGDQNNFMEH